MFVTTYEGIGGRFIKLVSRENKRGEWLPVPTFVIEKTSTVLVMSKGTIYKKKPTGNSLCIIIGEVLVELYGKKGSNVEKVK